VGAGATAGGALVGEMGRAAALTVPQKLLAELEREDWQRWWLSAFQAALRQGRRDALRLYPELLHMVGANDQLLELTLRALGVSLEVAKRAVVMYQQVEHLDDAGAAQLSADFLRERGWTCLPPEAAALGARQDAQDGLQSQNGGESDV